MMNCCPNVSVNRCASGRMSTSTVLPAGASELSTPSSMALDATRFGAGRFKFKAATVGHLGASGIRLISRRSPTDPDAFNYTAIYQHDGLALSGLVPELWISRIRTAA